MTLVGWASGSSDKDAEPCDRNLNLQPERFCNNGQDHKTRMNFQHNLCSGVKVVKKNVLIDLNRNVINYMGFSCNRS